MMGALRLSASVALLAVATWAAPIGPDNGEESVTSLAAPKRLPWPLDYTGVTQVFGSPINDPSGNAFGSEYNAASHHGVDLVADPFAPVFASETGTVVFVTRDGSDSGALLRSRGEPLPRSRGTCAIQRSVPPHRIIRYHHLDPASITVRVGDKVNQGHLLGEVAPFPNTRTQPDHLHVEVSSAVSTYLYPKTHAGLSISNQHFQDPESIFDLLEDTVRPTVAAVLRGPDDTIQLVDGKFVTAIGPRWLEIDVIDRAGSSDPRAKYVIPPKRLCVELESALGTTTSFDFDLSRDDPKRCVRLLSNRTQRVCRLCFALHSVTPTAALPVQDGAWLAPLGAGTYTIRAKASDSHGWGHEFVASTTLSD